MTQQDKSIKSCLQSTSVRSITIAFFPVIFFTFVLEISLKYMNKIIFPFYFLLTLSACAFAPPKLDLPNKIDVVSDIEPFLLNATEKGFPPSISLAIIYRDKEQYSHHIGYTDFSKNNQVSEDTVYQWWSLTKIFTAVAILQLQEKGLLNIDNPVVKHLPYFSVTHLNEKSAPITIRQLLSHSSGLGDVGISILGWIHFEDDAKVNQTEFLKEKLPGYNKLETQPGEEGRYSNIGYLVLAGVIESVSGESYEDYIVKNILSPLRMHKTNFVYTDTMTEFEAVGSHPKDALSYIVPFFIDTDRAIKEEHDGRMWFNRVYSDQQGATGLIGSTADMVKFMKALLSGGVLNGERILSEKSVLAMQSPVITVNDSPAPHSEGLEFGLGWFVGHSQSGKELTHSGAGMGFVTTLRLYPEKGVGVIVFSNSTYLGRSMGHDIVNLVGAVK